jgi:hypothetical protein
MLTTNVDVRRRLLELLLAERLRWWHTAEPADLGHRESRRRWRHDRERTRTGVYRYQPTRWLGRALTAPERVAFRHELLQMQRDGEVRLILGTDGRRIVAVQPLRFLTEGDPSSGGEAQKNRRNLSQLPNTSQNKS